MGATPPAEAVAALEARFGPFAYDLLSDRRGSRAWKIAAGRNRVVLKANAPEAEESRDKAAEIAQENDHLIRLARAHAIDPAYRVGAGEWEGGRWLAVRWVSGAPVWNALSPTRVIEGSTRAHRALLLSVARTWAARLAPMHAAGWVHADVQPTNTLVTDDGATEVIDYALSCGPDDGRRLPYRGALTHTTAPEIAAAILGTGHDVHVPARPTADVWSLGASLFWCWTGHRPGIYEDGDDRRDKLRALADRRLHALRDVRPWTFPALEELINACMAPDAGDRPTAEEIATW
ncbi:protein kinase [Streptomyces cinerochromogenes]|uniref:protein kinase domain-containing protein n=1 Tax=Streptomyces cinerochromogenes TaxID=66422 RepID=UPI0036BA0E09